MWLAKHALCRKLENAKQPEFYVEPYVAEVVNLVIDFSHAKIYNVIVDKEMPDSLTSISRIRVIILF